MFLISTGISNKTITPGKSIKDYCNNIKSIKIITLLDFIDILNQKGDNLELLNYIKKQPTLSSLKEKKQLMLQENIPIYGTSKLKSIHKGNLHNYFSGFNKNIFTILNENKNPDKNFPKEFTKKLFKIIGYKSMKLEDVKKKIEYSFSRDKYIFKSLQSQGLITIEGSGRNKTIKLN